MIDRCLRALGAALLLLAVATAAASGQASTTVILVRHAEKAATPANDPPLTSAGQARAKALAAALRDAGVDAIITTQFTRTRETAAPTAVALHLTPEVVAATGKTHVQDVAAAVRRHPGHTVLVVGHGNTVAEIIAALGGPAIPDLCDAEYDGLFILTIPPAGKPALVRAKYGAASDVASCEAMK
ncbi:MAG TPA: phosphoglycerate mutase family protein [Gemmatimonadaceae bacterium]|nr:phosphoglycerate mutase family protein [Gemmatimonadaceae bacterium]